MFDELSNLEVLLLYNNPELGELPGGVFDGLDSLSVLEMHKNHKLKEVPDGLFAGLGSLTELRLDSHDSLSDPASALDWLSPGVFEGLSGLKELDLNFSGLTDLPVGVFDGLDSLEVLYLDNNRLTELKPGVFDGLDRLEWLGLGANDLTTLPVGVFDGLRRLRTLYLLGNFNLHYSPYVLSPLVSLDEDDYDRPSAPGQPRGLAASSFTSGRIELRWDRPAGGAATSYQVARTVGGGDSETLVVDNWVRGRVAAALHRLRRGVRRDLRL